MSARVICGDCGSTISLDELDLPCDVCRSQKRGIFSEYRPRVMAGGPGFLARSAPELGPALAPAVRDHLYDEDWETWQSYFRGLLP